MAPAIDPRDDDAGEQEPSRSAEKRLGTVVAGSYRLTRHIGSGGSSHVFEAEHLRLGKPFAVKLLRPELDANRRTAQRFRREARAIARLKSEHIVSVIDCGEHEDGTPYLVMELLGGEDLRSLLDREGSLPARRAVPLIIEACRGLSEVHAAGLVHRDLKPENLFVSKRSTGEDWCKVLDFGVAKMEASMSTAEGAIVGTARYMAPEQLADSAAVGPSTDVYALGAILYECVSGRSVVVGSTVQEVMYRIMNAEPVPLSELAPTLPRALVTLIERCLRKSPSARPSSTEELATLLATAVAPTTPHLTANDTIGEDEGFQHPVPTRPSTRLPRAAAILLAILSTGFGGWYARGSSASPTSLPAAAQTALPVLAPPVAVASPAVTSTRAPEMPAPSGSPPANSPATPPQPASSTRAPSVVPHLVTSAAARPAAASRFDSNNPYAE